MNENESTRLLDAREVSKMLYSGHSTVYKWAKEGSLPCIRFGRSVRFLYADVIQFIEENRINNINKFHGDGSHPCVLDS